MRSSYLAIEAPPTHTIRAIGHCGAPSSEMSFLVAYLLESPSQPTHDFGFCTAADPRPDQGAAVHSIIVDWKCDSSSGHCTESAEVITLLYRPASSRNPSQVPTASNHPSSVVAGASVF